MLPEPPIWLILLAFICLLGPLVFFHELGHYLVARLLRIPAEAFSIGFGREIFGWTDKQGTRWKIAWLPLGGYVKFVGDMNAASMPEDAEQVPPELRDRAFQFRPVWQRFLVVLAGPVANFLLAFVIFVGFFAAVGMPATSNLVVKVQQGSAAEQARIEPGDRILKVAGHDTPTFEDIATVVLLRPGESTSVTVQRRGAVLQLPIIIHSATERDRFGQPVHIGRIGVLGAEQTYVKLPVTRLLPAAATFTLKITRGMVESLWRIVTGRVERQDVGGPIKIAQMAGQQAELGVLPFVELLALFSINLGFINLLPVPLTDGGHLLFYAVEAIRRRPLSAQALDWAFRGGLAVILALMIFLTLNDLGSVGLWDRLQRLIG